MNATNMIDRRPAEFDQTANRFRDDPRSPIEDTDCLADVVVLPHVGTSSRSVGSSSSWVTLDEQWGKRLGARRNGKRYRLSRSEFVRKMAELNAGLLADPQVQTTGDAYETLFKLRTIRTVTSISQRASSVATQPASR